MRMTVLASGSKGNSTVIASSSTRVLVDAGLSCRELIKRMREANEDPAALDAILITHEHQDHVAGMATLARRLRIPVFLTEPTHRAWVRMMTPRTTMSYAQWLDRLAQERAQREKLACAESQGVPHDHRGGAEVIVGSVPPPPHTPEDNSPTSASQDLCTPIPLEAESADPDPDEQDESPTATPKPHPTFLPAVEYFHSGTNFSIGDISITPFTIPHDAADPCGFVFEAEGVRMAIATDLGYMPPNVKSALKRADVLLLESNHDLEMLKDGPYPWSVKQRVLSRVGHLSNHATAEFLARDYDGGAACIVLGHLSEANNAPGLALLSAQEAIGNRMTLLGNRILLAQQTAPLAPICL
jgi:phosphoribosyl 1,2-cyclic phosphodiesterase